MGKDREKYIKIYFDGGSRGNPGPSAIGAVFYGCNGKKLGQLSEYIGPNTNNIAEYISLEKALEYAGKNYDAEKIILLTDSQLLNNQLKKIWKIKDKNILEIYLRITEKLSKYDTVDLRHIPREQNMKADRLVNQALDSKEIIYEGESGINFGNIEE